MEIKIAHCADIHLGMNTNKSDYISCTRKNEIKSSFFDMVEIIQKNNVDLFLIAGDLFHDVDINDTEVSAVKNAFKSLTCYILIAPGNHDPFASNSPYFGAWPDNVYIFKQNTITCHNIDSLKTRVWGSAFTCSNNSGAKVKADKNDGFINILLTHGTYPPADKNSYNPISIYDIKNSGMNYIALGHIHKRTPVLREGNTFYAYPGCLEGRSFKETGEKGFYLGTLSNTHCKMDFVKMSKRIYCEIEIDITDLRTSVDVCDNILFNIKQNYGENYKKNLYKIVLWGIVLENFILDISYIKNKLEEKLFFVEIEDKTELQCSDSSNNLKNIFIQKGQKYIKNCQNDEDVEIAKLALKLGVRSFSQEVGYNEN